MATSEVQVSWSRTLPDIQHEDDDDDLNFLNMMKNITRAGNMEKHEIIFLFYQKNFEMECQIYLEKEEVIPQNK